jgi:hypothetical protein
MATSMIETVYDMRTDRPRTPDRPLLKVTTEQLDGNERTRRAIFLRENNERRAIIFGQDFPPEKTDVKRTTDNSLKKTISERPV